MAVRLTNRARHLLIVPLNSGKTVHLAPGESSGPIADLEIVGNERVAKLSRYGLMTTMPAERATVVASAAIIGKGGEFEKDAKKELKKK